MTRQWALHKVPVPAVTFETVVHPDSKPAWQALRNFKMLTVAAAAAGGGLLLALAAALGRGAPLQSPLVVALVAGAAGVRLGVAHRFGLGTAVLLRPVRASRPSVEGLNNSALCERPRKSRNAFR